MSEGTWVKRPTKNELKRRQDPERPEKREIVLVIQRVIHFTIAAADYRRHGPYR